MKVLTSSRLRSHPLSNPNYSNINNVINRRSASLLELALIKAIIGDIQTNK